MNKDLPPPTVNKPLNEKRYTTFYHTMLILSTIGTAAAVINLTSLPATISLYSVAPLNSILGIAGHVVTLVAVLALVLLWRKDVNGLYLKLGTYATTVLITIGLFFTGESMAKEIIKQIKKEFSSQGIAVDDSFVSTLSYVSIYVSISMGIVTSIVFGLLWWFAWKKQVKADSGV
ncbi:MAG TPA: hypothetical protein PK265_00405 [Candidatus Saccharibacteria bacterium]|nr:hypothetical protein [Candidatus Saccharibacteria bacterium]HRQ97774.1 hypothetical protein [Candidatus Saccharibacteria bacterium]